MNNFITPHRQKDRQKDQHTATLDLGRLPIPNTEVFKIPIGLLIAKVVSQKSKNTETEEKPKKTISRYSQ